MATSTITSKGQITIPKAMREALGLHIGEQVVFVLRADRSFSIQSRKAASNAFAPRLVDVPGAPRGRVSEAPHRAKRRRTPWAVNARSAVRIDANIVLRHLLGEPPDQAARASRLFAAATRGEVSVVIEDVVLAEVVWTLSCFTSSPG